MDFKTEFSRDTATVIIVISCESEDKLTQAIKNEFNDMPNFANMLIEECDWDDVTDEIGIR